MCERLREVSELLARQADLLGEEAKVVRVGEHLLECESASSSRPALARASTYQNVQIENVPSEPCNPSGEALGPYQYTEAVGDQFIASRRGSTATSGRVGR